MLLLVMVIAFVDESGGHPPSRCFGAAGRPPLQLLCF